MSVKSLENLYVACPLGLGDFFVCNSLIRDWANLAQELYLPVPQQSLPTVKCLYSEVPNVKPILFPGLDHERDFIAKHNLSVINFRTIFETTPIWYAGNPTWDTIAVYWDRQIYEFWDVPFSSRYRNFQLPKVIPGAEPLRLKLNPYNEPFVLWHPSAGDRPSGFDIDLVQWRRANGLPDKKIISIEPGHTDNMLDYIKLIQQADEIHVVGSSFHCLVDSICSELKADLFYHDVRKTTVMQINSRWNNYRWNPVRYHNKA